MRHSTHLLTWLSICLLSAFSNAQAPSTASNGVAPIAANAIAAFAPGPVHQIQLSGSAKAYAGSDEPNGTFTATLQSTGETNLHLDLGELSRTESTEAFGETRKCTWAGQDGVQHDAAHHNCQAVVNWLVPALDLQTRVGELTYNAAATVQEGISVQELSLTHPSGSASPPAALISRLSTAKLAIDPKTFLPTSLTFSIHPDNDAGLDIPIVVHYSDYRQLNGISLPFRIQKYMNNGLVLDLQVETAEVQ